MQVAWPWGGGQCGTRLVASSAGRAQCPRWLIIDPLKPGHGPGQQRDLLACQRGPRRDSGFELPAPDPGPAEAQAGCASGPQAPGGCRLVPVAKAAAGGTLSGLGFWAAALPRRRPSSAGATPINGGPERDVGDAGLLHSSTLQDRSHSASGFCAAVSRSAGSERVSGPLVVQVSGSAKLRGGRPCAC